VKSQQEDTFEFAKSAKECGDVIKLAKTFGALLRPYGVTNSSAWAVVGGDPKVEKGFGEWPREWARKYNDRRYFDIDPVLRSLLAGGLQGYWDEILENTVKQDDDDIVMKDAAAHGFPDGYSLLIATPGGAVYLVSLYGKKLDRSPDTRLLFEMSSFVFVHEGVRLLHRNVGFRPKLFDLTKRQVEALSYKAQNLTDAETATKMGVSVKTVEGLLEKARKTLRVSRTSQAIMVAKEKGVIKLPPQTATASKKAKKVFGK
jgi:DNA-binding CsgD family transcriptional regulator